MYKIYQYHQEDKYFIHIYDYPREKRGLFVKKDKDSGQWDVIPFGVLSDSAFVSDYHCKAEINLNNLIITHVLGALDIV